MPEEIVRVTTSVIDRFVTRAELAQQIGIAPKTLANWAAEVPPRGPRITHIGRVVRYRQSDVDAWLEAFTVVPAGHQWRERSAVRKRAA